MSSSLDQTASTSEQYPWHEGLPAGFSVIGASAGTGKTFTLAGLAAVAVADGRCTASELLILTFSRNAAAELQHRVRQRISDSLRWLNSPEGDPPDDIAAWMSDCDASVQKDRRGRLQQCVVEFDVATITTIHGFANQIRAGIGASAGVDRYRGLLDDVVDRIPEVTADLLTAEALSRGVGFGMPTASWESACARSGCPCAEKSGCQAVVVPTPDKLAKAINLAVNTRAIVRPNQVDADLVGLKGSGVTCATFLLAQLARDGVDELNRRRSCAGTMSFDDLLALVSEAVATGESATAGQLRDRYKVALIDEFQDTDLDQWKIFSSLFLSPSSESTLVIVGDPKQSIYSFRGADLQTYVDAAAREDAGKFTLGVNYRSSQAVLDATAHLFDGVQFGHPEVFFETVSGAPGASKMGFEIGGNIQPGLEIRSIFEEDLNAESARGRAMDDMAARVHETLDHGEITNSSGVSRNVNPKEVAVLVRTGAEAVWAQSVLRRRGIPAVLARSGSVLESPAAEQWRWLLDAMVRPADPKRARGFALSWFGGMDAADVARAPDKLVASWSATLADWSHLLANRGASSFVRNVVEESGVSEFVLKRPDGDRALTDLLHLGELISVVSESGVVSSNPAGLLERLGDAAFPSDTEQDNDAEARRVETDDLSVQIMTIWVSKGLEFPIVFCPTLFSAGLAGTTYHDDQGMLTAYMKNSSTPTKAQGDRYAKIASEWAAERMRLLYVALTRAEAHTTVWWANIQSGEKSPLARVLFGERVTGVLTPELLNKPADLPALADQKAHLDELVKPWAPVVSAVSVPEGPVAGQRWTSTAEHQGSPELKAAQMHRSPLRNSSRWSFTAITSRDHKPASPWDTVGNDRAGDDEQSPPDEVVDESIELEAGGTGLVDDSVASTSAASSLSSLPAGAEFGTLCHAVLEELDFATGEDALRLRVSELVDAAQSWRRVNLDFVDAAGSQIDGLPLLERGLVEVLETPLGPPFGGLRLRDLLARDRLNEMDFDLRLGGAFGSVSAADSQTIPVATDAEIGAVMLAHLEPGDPFYEWARSLSTGIFDVKLDGMLTGSIDLVARVQNAEGQQQFVVVDYKSNRLHNAGEAPVARDYSQASMSEAMVEHHYPLQALLYSVALHRYLRWRMSSYRPDIHLGGAAYLFLRGMSGASTAMDSAGINGVCAWSWPTAAVLEVSDLLDGYRGGES